MSLRNARITAALLLLGLPLASGWLAGLPAGFAELPPRTVYIHPPAFSAVLYAVLIAAWLGVILFLARPGLLGFGRRRSDLEPFQWAFTPDPGHRFPARGWVGLGLVAVSWPAAWAHPDWLGPAADHTFFPLWLGYILTVDGLVNRRTGTSPAVKHTGAWLAWFPASAVMWWYFELLNRFIQNWLYLGVDDMPALRYVLGSTLAFSTVIPAVLTTAAYLSTFDCFRTRFARTDAGHAPPAALWWALIAAGASGLTLMPWLPIALFPLIWVAPLLVVAGLLERAGLGLETGLGRLVRGDWGPVVILAVATLVCGFFWELWNIHAMPKWVYQVPWLDRFKLFEMPIVGYLGYLPFGPACWAFWQLFSASERDRRI